ncbi:response regulator transcription factor [Alkaliphilus sp. B6464]|uniref:response regulator transcription factor n=1 Tax=Alkaliphilus sp. B6464 TaxID=2731219 RepID=UPI001BAB827F|nr:response regulator [Alkaliphilus sp. B6464]QUH19560.1 response regulator [Alkaliphilus sp. B6464]
MWKVLIADDEPKIRKGLKKMLQSFNLELEIVAEAEEGEMALDLAKEHIPHILLVDINMPFLDGLGFIEKVHNFLPYSIVIIITGYDEFHYAQRAIKLQVFDYLLKPINSEELKNIIIKGIVHLQNQPKNMENIGAINNNEEEYSPIVVLLKNYMDSHYMQENLSLHEVAEKFDISPSYLGKLMKHELGKTFIEYLTEIRIENAKKMLQEENIGIKIHEVAQLVGYSSQHYFSRVFKKEVGVSPIEYKQNIKIEPL